MLSSHPACRSARGLGAAAIALTLTMSMSFAVDAATLHVPAQHSTIQAAINAATDGDAVVVAPGTYAETIDLLGKAITVRGSGGSSVTTLDAHGLAGRVVTVVNCGPGTLIEGLTLKGGSAPGPFPLNNGGGMLIHSATVAVVDCVFVVNSANWGGGLAIEFSSVTVDNCTFASNSAQGRGGALYVANSVLSGGPTEIKNCQFRYNSAGDAGAVYVGVLGQPILRNCGFLGNVATGHGGAILAGVTSQPVVDRCEFTENTAWGGGAIATEGAWATIIVNSTFRDNDASSGGGALRDLGAFTQVVNSLFVGNGATAEGSAISSVGPLESQVLNCTIVGNSGGLAAIWSDTNALLVTNCIIWDNAPAQVAGDASVGASTVQGGYPGGNSAADPLFANPAMGNYRLTALSPAVDNGSNAQFDQIFVPVTTDLAGMPRFVAALGVDPQVDRGAYERQSGIPAPNGIIWVPGDFSTIQPAIDFSANGATILVEGGTHPPIDFKGKAIAVSSTSGPAIAIIDGTGHSGSVVTCVSGEGPQTVLEGFTITGGAVAANGGGMRNSGSSPTVKGCIFVGNSAGTFGGGMSNFNSSPTVIDCIFLNNSAASAGGGMFNNNLSNPLVIDCLFEGNSGGINGGGMLINNSNPTVRSSTFTANTAENGAGMVIAAGSSPLVEECIFDGNVATAFGGGLASGDSTPTITGSAFSRNAAVLGGGIYVTGTGATSLGTSSFCGNAPNALTGTWIDLGGNAFLGFCAANCPADLDGNGVVDGADLGLLLNAWGACG